MENIKKLINNSQLNLSTLIAFTRAEHKIHNLEYKTIKDSGLTISQFGVLEALYNKGDLRIGEIMQKILTTSGNITVVIKNLEKDGFIKKNPDPLDKRSTIISITDKGINTIEEILPEHIKNINNIFSILTDEEKLVLKEILKKFKQL
jgi:MarR family transcriptional regulator, 2-MHQ and catechol-resistance regulon repressor